MNIAIQYLVWKTNKSSLCLRSLDVHVDDVVEFSSTADEDALAARLVQLGDQMPTGEERDAFVRKLAVLLEVDQVPIEQMRMFHILTMDSVKKLHDAGVDIQMHTHRHTLGSGAQDEIFREIQDNRRAIVAACHNHPVHFCYPNGDYRKSDFLYLTECDVVSATTCNSGLNSKSTNLMELNRFLDGENISQIEFESELAGFSELLRQVRTKFAFFRYALIHRNQPELRRPA